MRPERKSLTLLGVTQSKAKMFEYDVPNEQHIEVQTDPIQLAVLSIGLLSDVSNKINAANEPIQIDPVLFSAQFFDSYRETRFAPSLSPYLTLLGAAAYYLTDLPGSSSVLSKNLAIDSIDLEARGLDRLLEWVVKGEFLETPTLPESPFKQILSELFPPAKRLANSGAGADNVFEILQRLRRIVYSIGTDREVLFANVASAVLKKRFWNSVWYRLPIYSGVDVREWRRALGNRSIRELWPAQHLLGREGIFSGESGVVQMPTSAGKTRSTELILRSAFMSKRASFAVIVAPFRALCHEIAADFEAVFRGENVVVSELSDVTQMDLEVSFDQPEGINQVFVVTPEKLIYLLRQVPEVANKIGLLIYDEGHQFDSASRGVTYELLVTTLKSLVPFDVQTILISAVIVNAEAVNDWLNDQTGVVASGSGLIPTFRNVAFSSWTGSKGRLQFVSSSNPERSLFFVPRILERLSISRKPRERKLKMFPDKDDGKSVASYLGLKLVKNGAVAIFCGRKSSAASICADIVDKFDRDLQMPRPSEFSDPEELQKLVYLAQSHFGENSTWARASSIGVFAHHGSTPSGLRLSIEYAMKHGHIRFVVCTSTLAQGVNLPIRYLLVTSIYQGADKIKVRDFHNLIGRAGRSGMHTEGNVIFADPEIYDKRETSKKDIRRWNTFTNMLTASNSEPCASMLLKLFEEIRNDTRTKLISFAPLEIVQGYVSDEEYVSKTAAEIVSQFGSEKFSKESVEAQLLEKTLTIRSLESFIMAHWEENDDFRPEVIERLAMGTLGYHLATKEQKPILLELFRLLTTHLESFGLSHDTLKVYGKTLLGVRETISVERWAKENYDALLGAESITELLSVVWPFLENRISNRAFRKCTVRAPLYDLAVGWIQGEVFSKLFSSLKEAGAKVGHFKLTSEHIVDLCENALGYDASLQIGALAISISWFEEFDADLVQHLEMLQKRLKYGVKSMSVAKMYEIGFGDRNIASELVTEIGSGKTRVDALANLAANYDSVKNILGKYPKYFSERLETLVVRPREKQS
jgi:superfamily II DNA/RNA helicase